MDSHERAQEAVKALEETGGNKTAAAKLLGITRASFRRRINRAAAFGYMGAPPKPVAPGFEITKTSHWQTANGEWRESLKTAPESGEEFEIPDGFHFSKGTYQVGPDGHVERSWPRVSPDQQTLQDVIDAAKSVFENYKGYSALPPPPTDFNADCMNLFPRADFHLGLYAWAEETRDSDFDLSIGEEILREATKQLFASAPRAETALIVGLGDLTHADNDTNTTPASGNRLDVDTRYPKVLRVAISVEIAALELALQTHNKVVWRLMRGNHDPHVAVAVSCAVAMFFANNSRVEIDLSPSMFFYHRFGETLNGFTHGHTVKQNALPLIMANHRPDDWSCRHKFYHTGHVHHREMLELGGVVCEKHRSPAAKDAWHAEHGYIAGRSMSSITYHRTHGEQSRRTVNIPPH